MYFLGKVFIKSCSRSTGEHRWKKNFYINSFSVVVLSSIFCMFQRTPFYEELLGKAAIGEKKLFFKVSLYIDVIHSSWTPKLLLLTIVTIWMTNHEICQIQKIILSQNNKKWQISMCLTWKDYWMNKVYYQGLKSICRFQKHVKHSQC